MSKMGPSPSSLQGLATQFTPVVTNLAGSAISTTIMSALSDVMAGGSLSSPPPKYTKVLKLLDEFNRPEIVLEFLKPYLPGMSLNEFLSCLSVITTSWDDLIKVWFQTPRTKVKFDSVSDLKTFSNRVEFLNLLDLDYPSFQAITPQYRSDFNQKLWITTFSEYLPEYELKTCHTRFLYLNSFDFPEVAKLAPLDSFILENALLETRIPENVAELISMGANVDDTVIKKLLNSPECLLQLLAHPKRSISDSLMCRIFKIYENPESLVQTRVKDLLNSKGVISFECTICLKGVESYFALTCSNQATNPTRICALCSLKLENKCPTCRAETLTVES